MPLNDTLVLITELSLRTIESLRDFVASVTDGSLYRSANIRFVTQACPPEALDFLEYKRFLCLHNLISITQLSTLTQS